MAFLLLRVEGERSESQKVRGKRAVPKEKISRRRRPRRYSSIGDSWCEACLALHGRDMLWIPEFLALIYVTACTACGRGVDGMPPMQCGMHVELSPRRCGRHGRHGIGAG